MSKKEACQYAAELLDRLKEIDRGTVEAYYEMGRILAAISGQQLYELLGYTSMSAMIDEELSYSATTAAKYAATYQHLRRLKINKKDALKLMHQHGYTMLSRVLPKTKPLSDPRNCARVIKKAVDNAHKQCKQVNFQMTENEWLLLIDALESYGAEWDGKRLHHASEALLVALDILELEDAA